MSREEKEKRKKMTAWQELEATILKMRKEQTLLAVKLLIEKQKGK